MTGTAANQTKLLFSSCYRIAHRRHLKTTLMPCGQQLVASASWAAPRQRPKLAIGAKTNGVTETATRCGATEQPSHQVQPVAKMFITPLIVAQYQTYWNGSEVGE